LNALPLSNEDQAALRKAAHLSFTCMNCDNRLTTKPTISCKQIRVRVICPGGHRNTVVLSRFGIYNVLETRRYKRS
jgi:hypothetical protein